MSIRIFLALALAMAGGRGAPAQDSFPGETLGLSAEVAAGADPITLHIASPYANRPFSLLARSPGGHWFGVAAGVTGPTGRGAIALRLRGSESIDRLNAAFAVSVDGAKPGTRLLSSPIHVEAGRGQSMLSPWTGFARVDGGPQLSGSAAVSEIADLDTDGDQDLIVITQDEAGKSTVRILINGGTGSFAEETEARIGLEAVPGASNLALADLDGDGAVDLFVTTYEGSASNAMFHNNGVGVFAAVPAFPAKAMDSIQSNAAVLADFDGDGDVDIFIANGMGSAHGAPAVPQDAELLVNEGGMDFTTAEGGLPVDDPRVSRAAAAGDVDLDGDLDLVVGNAGTNQLLRNDGAGHFTGDADRFPGAAESTFGVALGDVDQDGDLDIVYANVMFNPAAQALLINQGGLQGGETGTFVVGDFPPIASGQSPIRLAAHINDFDGDGDADVLFVAHELGSSEHPDLYLNQGGRQGGIPGTFLLDAAFPAAAAIYATVPVGDIDGDGDLDLLGLPNGRIEPELEPVANYLLLNRLFEAPDPPLAFRRGDINADLDRDLSDAVFLLSYLYLGGETPGCLAAADLDDNQVVELTDAVVLLGHLFLGERDPAAPFPGLGDDPTPGGVSCDRVEIFEEVR